MLQKENVATNDAASSKRPKILVTADFSECYDSIKHLSEVATVDYRPAANRETVLEAIADCDAYLGVTFPQIDEAVLQRAPKLRVVCTASTGTDHIDLEGLRRRGIHLISITTEYALLDSFTATAELAWGLLLACSRQIPRLFERAKAGEIGLLKGQPLPRQLSQKTLGIIGCGRLGRMIAQFGKAFRMRVLVCDVRPIKIEGVEQVDFERLITTADIISLHVHLREDTFHIINRDAIARMKPGVILINTARGDLIDEEAMVDALQSGHIGAAGIDVVHNEWDPNLQRRLLLEYARSHDNLVLTPHVGGATLESITGARVFVAEKLSEYFITTPSASRSSGSGASAASMETSHNDMRK
jgi:D-3-phosphoglycerate dehydrogenase / 2-oxoglutarate reductase